MSFPAMPSAITREVLRRLSQIQVGTFEPEASAVSVAPFPSGFQGALCVSVDFDFPERRRDMHKKLLTDGTRALIRLSEEYRVPLTWAICVQTAIEEPDLFREILSSRVAKEIAFHTFSHLDLSSPTIGQERIQEDFSQGIKLLEESGKPNSFVFPSNAEGHHDLLVKFGFTSYRGFDGGPMLTYPSLKNGMWDIHASYYVRDSEPFAFVPQTLLGLAVRFAGVAHMWTHPWSIHIRGDVNKFTESVMEPVFRLASKMRDNGTLWPATMQEIASYCESRVRATVEQARIENGKIRFLSKLYGIESMRMVPREVTFKIRFPRAARQYHILVDGLSRARGSANRSLFREIRLDAAISDVPKDIEIVFD